MLLPIIRKNPRKISDLTYDISSSTSQFRAASLYFYKAGVDLKPVTKKVDQPLSGWSTPASRITSKGDWRNLLGKLGLL
ncbi:hypothetical protein [Pseudolactococcus carnosus]|uniref:Uncharacterized protein n=1 Tax=Pseudolactococcus carnosus TaxID=2749961 RepID=A0ABT0ATW2_9LACT|nr:hypothetical protein [Lactococcus carnosus]MCJ1978988.1 hypothetical protein [Lactococcus carnosus]MCJ1990166.1 hypothetical protein [Lactococcus carnosus]MCJ2001918.1 hypothetical protein [Lactococcus carnosus]